MNKPYLSTPYIKGKKLHRFSLRELILNHAVKLLWGQGYTLKGADKGVIEEILNSIRGEVFFPASERVLFDQGHIIVVTRRTLSGDLKISVPLLWGSSNVSTVFGEEVLAVIWERIVIDDASFILKSVFDTHKTEISFHRGDGKNGVLGEVVTLGEARKLARRLDLPLVDNHNSGICQNMIGEWYPDTFPSGDNLTEIQEHLEKIFDNIEWELDYNRTVVFMGMTPQEQQEVKDNPSKLDEKFNRFIIKNQGAGNNYLDANLELQKSGLPVDIMQGKPQLEVLANYVNYTADRGFNVAGYNSPWGTREHGTNKTSSEVSINMQNDYLTTAIKKRLREAGFNRLWTKIGKAYLSKPNLDCKIEIHGMSTMEKEAQPEQIMQRFQLGLISRKSALIKLDNISEEEAEKMVKEIEKEQSQIALQNQPLNSSNSNGNGSGAKKESV